MALVNKGAAMLVKDDQAADSLMKVAVDLLGEPEKIAAMEKNIATLALKNAALTIADEIYKIVD